MQATREEFSRATCSITIDGERTCPWRWMARLTACATPEQGAVVEFQGVGDYIAIMSGWRHDLGRELCRSPVRVFGKDRSGQVKATKSQVRMAIQDSLRNWPLGRRISRVSAINHRRQATYLRQALTVAQPSPHTARAIRRPALANGTCAGLSRGAAPPALRVVRSIPANLNTLKR